jgi:hypothetical protein
VRAALKRDLEAARYAADRAFRQYDAADPANRLVAGELEARWNKALACVAEVEGKIAAHDAAKVAPVADPAFVFAYTEGLDVHQNKKLSGKLGFATSRSHPPPTMTSSIGFSSAESQSMPT